MVYFPNGTAGMVLDEQCSNCPVGEDACPIYAVQMVYNYDQLKNGNKDLKDAMTMLVDDKGRCQMLESLKRAGRSKPDPDPTPIDPSTLPGFLRLDR